MVYNLRIKNRIKQVRNHHRQILFFQSKSSMRRSSASSSCASFSSSTTSPLSSSELITFRSAFPEIPAFLTLSGAEPGKIPISTASGGRQAGNDLATLGRKTVDSSVWDRPRL